jgi:predicted PhzF superfamily epimerase YddE/YHI9
MGLAICQVDAFTERPFAGNPAAVCLLPGVSFPETGWMQALALEMNLSETAFLVRRGEGAEYGLRWFTPAIEVELCGHATLASAHVLWEMGAVAAAAPIRFHTLSGVLGAERRGEWIELDFPAEPASALTEPPPGLADLLGASAVWVGANRFDLVVELEDEAAVRSLAPDFRRLAALPYRGFLVTARGAAPGYDGCPASSLQLRASTRTRSPVRPTAASDPTGAAAWARTRSSAIRPRPAAALSGWSWPATASGWAARR